MKNFGRFKSYGIGLLSMLVAAVVLAAIVNAQQVADAVRNSPNASQWLRNNADAVGRLAMFESGGRLDVYNQSCCYGVLQMNRSNIRDRGYTPEQFQQLSLQDQVNAWAHIMSNALTHHNPKTLATMGNFDGRTVTGDMVLACVQLGIGNCGKMIRSGSCSGFADINGTTICKMADKIAGGTSNPATPPDGNPGSDTGNTNTSPGNKGYVPFQNCVRDASGSCVPMTQAMEIGFETGSGTSMSRLKSTIGLIVTATTVLIMASMLLSLWRQFSTGRIATAELVIYTQKIGFIMLMIFIALALL